MNFRPGSGQPKPGARPQATPLPKQKGGLEKQKAQADALKRHQPKRTGSGEFPAVPEE